MGVPVAPTVALLLGVVVSSRAMRELAGAGWEIGNGVQVLGRAFVSRDGLALHVMDMGKRGEASLSGGAEPGIARRPRRS